MRKRHSGFHPSPQWHTEFLARRIFCDTDRRTNICITRDLAAREGHVGQRLDLGVLSNLRKDYSEDAGLLPLGISSAAQPVFGIP